MSLQFKFDVSQVNKNLKDLMEKSMPEHLSQALYAAGNAIINDANTDIPKTPHKYGNLRRSASVEPDPDNLGVKFGYTVPYAAKLHEAPENWNWTLSGSGPKYLLTKMINNGKKYLQILADYLKNRLGT